MERRLIKLIPLCFLLFSSNISAQQNELEEKIHHYFANLNLPQDKVKVKILSSPTHINTCSNIKIGRVFNKNPWGKISLPIYCDQKKLYIQTDIQVSGKYWSTKNIIAKNTLLNDSHLVLKNGILNKLPANVIRKKSDWNGYMTLHSVSAAQPITRSMLKKPWVISAGQNIIVQAKNDQFKITAEGKALNNAIEGQEIRLRMPNGEIVNALAQKGGYATIVLLSR